MLIVLAPVITFFASALLLPCPSLMLPGPNSWFELSFACLHTVP